MNAWKLAGMHCCSPPEDDKPPLHATIACKALLQCKISLYTYKKTILISAFLTQIVIYSVLSQEILSAQESTRCTKSQESKVVKMI